MSEHNQEPLVVFRNYPDMMAAVIDQQKLENADIKSMVDDADAVALEPMAGVDLRILSGDVVKALEILGLPK